MFVQDGFSYLIVTRHKLTGQTLIVQNIQEMDTKGVYSQKVSVSAHNPPNLC